MRDGTRKIGVAPRQVVRRETDAREDIRVLSGILALCATDSSGNHHIVGLRFPGEAVLARAYNVRVIALVASEIEVGRIDGEERAILHEINEVIGQVWMARVLQRDATGAVAHFLCELAVRLGGQPEEGHYREIVCPFSQLQIAQATGQTSVNVNRVLAELKLAGTIARPAMRTFRFLDWDELQRRGGFNPAYLD